MEEYRQVKPEDGSSIADELNAVEAEDAKPPWTLVAATEGWALLKRHKPEAQPTQPLAGYRDAYRPQTP